MLGSKFKLLLIIIISLSFETYGKEYGEKSFNNEIIINSDNLIYDKGSNVAHFESNVILWFNNMVLKTSNIKILYKVVEGRNGIDKIVIPNKLFALRHEDSSLLVADRGTYLLEKGELMLEGNVILQHVDNILKTNKLVLITELKKIADH